MMSVSTAYCSRVIRWEETRTLEFTLEPYTEDDLPDSADVLADLLDLPRDVVAAASRAGCRTADEIRDFAERYR